MSNTSLSSVKELSETQSSFSSEKAINVDNSKVAGFADERKEKLQRSEKQVTLIFKGLQASTSPDDNFISANEKPEILVPVDGLQCERPESINGTDFSPIIEIIPIKRSGNFPDLERKVLEKESTSFFPNIKKKIFKDHKAVAEKRLQRELVEMKKYPRPLISANLKGDNLFEWEAIIEGPPDSPYEGGKFLLDLSFPDRYPFSQPKITFKTKVYHCNINSKGDISLDILNRNWTSSYTVATVLLSIQSFLTDCNPNDPLVPAIAAQYKNDRKLYDETCKEWTKKYASEQ